MHRSRILAAVGAVSAAAVLAASIAVPPAVQARPYLEHGQADVSEPPANAVAWPRRTVLALHSAPRSPGVLRMLGRRTSFGSPTSLAVTQIGSGWAEVISSALPNGGRAYVALEDVSLTYDPVTLEIDLSQHRLRAWRMGRLVRELSVATGSPSSPTPTGRYAITDKLTNFFSFAYGCCVLALSGHQEQLPSGWHGGDRLAIHGGGSIGLSRSNGCLHASEHDLHWLLRRVPLGTQVTIHA